MKIVITDGYTLNPGDLSWKDFNDLGEVIYYDRTLAAQALKRCSEATVIITNKTPVTRETIQAAHQLKVIAVTATGYNVVDTVAAKEHGVWICNVPEYGTYSVAQHTFSLLLELTNQVGKHASSVKTGEWVNAIDWCYAKTPIMELKDKVMGIVGLGKIGNQTARIAEIFGMKVIYNGGRPIGATAKDVSMETLFSESDVISLHCPLKPDNHSFVNNKLLRRMKPTAFLINTSRGQLINEPDLAEALRNGTLAGAALDVLSQEPPPPKQALLNISNCLITPHMAWLSFEARQRIMNTTLENVKAALAGKPRNIVVK